MTACFKEVMSKEGATCTCTYGAQKPDLLVHGLVARERGGGTPELEHGPDAVRSVHHT